MERLLSGLISLFLKGFKFGSFLGSCPLNAISALACWGEISLRTNCLELSFRVNSMELSVWAESAEHKEIETNKINIPRIQNRACKDVGFNATFLWDTRIN